MVRRAPEISSDGPGSHYSAVPSYHLHSQQRVWGPDTSTQGHRTARALPGNPPRRSPNKPAGLSMPCSSWTRYHPVPRLAAVIRQGYTAGGQVALLAAWAPRSNCVHMQTTPRVPPPAKVPRTCTPRCRGTCRRGLARAAGANQHAPPGITLPAPLIPACHVCGVYYEVILRKARHSTTSWLEEAKSTPLKVRVSWAKLGAGVGVGPRDRSQMRLFVRSTAPIIGNQ